MTNPFGPAATNQSPDLRYPVGHREGSRPADPEAIARATEVVAIDSAEGLLLGPDGLRHPAESDGYGNLKTVLADEPLALILHELKAIRLGMQLMLGELNSANDIDLLDAVSDEL